MDNIWRGFGRFGMIILGVYEIIVASNISFALRRDDSDTALLFVFAAFLLPLMTWTMWRASLWAYRGFSAQ